MKSILFISPSYLSANLFQSVLPLLSSTVEITHEESLAQAQETLNHHKFHLIILDFSTTTNPEHNDEIKKITQHEIKTLAFFPASTSEFKSKLTEIPELKIFRKPFLPDELAELVMKNLN